MDALDGGRDLTQDGPQLCVGKNLGVSWGQGCFNQYDKVSDGGHLRCKETST